MTAVSVLPAIASAAQVIEDLDPHRQRQVCTFIAERYGYGMMQQMLGVVINSVLRHRLTHGLSKAAQHSVRSLKCGLVTLGTALLAISAMSQTTTPSITNDKTAAVKFSNTDFSKIDVEKPEDFKIVLDIFKDWLRADAQGWAKSAYK
jgi:hypothetical protein